MNTINVVPYSKKLLEGFSYDGAEVTLSGNQIIPIIDWYASLGTAHVIEINDKAIGAGGCYPLWNNSVSFWLFLNKEAQAYKISIFKEILSYMDDMIKKYEAKAILVNCVEGNLKAEKLIKLLGFYRDKDITMRTYIKRG